MIVRELVTKLGFKADKTALKNYESSINSLKNSMLAIVGASTAIVGGLFAMAKSAADYGDEIKDTSQKIGLSTDALQKFRYVAKRAGMETANFDVGMRMLSRSVSDAKEGTGLAVDALKKLKIDPKQLKDGESALLTISEKIAAMPDGMAKTKIAMDLFGRSGADLIPFMNQGTEAIKEQMQYLEDLGAVMGKDAIAAGDEFNDQWDSMKYAIVGVKNAIGIAVLPAFKQLVDMFLKWWVVNKDIVKAKFEVFVQKLGVYIERIPDYVQAIIDKVDKLTSTFGGLYNTVKLLIYAFGILWAAKQIANIVMLTKAIIQLGASLNTAKIAGVGLGTALGKIAIIIAGALAWAEVIKTIYNRWDEFKEAVKITGEYLWRILKWVTGIVTGLRYIMPETFKWEDKDFYGNENVRPKIPEGLQGAVDAAGGVDAYLAQMKAAKPVVNGGAPVNNTNTTIKNDNKIEIRVETGANPEDIASIVTESLDDMMSRNNANAARTIEGSAY